MEKIEEVNVSDDELKEIIAMWNFMSNEEQLKYRSLLPKVLAAVRGSPRLYFNVWQNTTHEVQEYNLEVFKDVLEMAENNASYGLPFFGIWNHTSPQIADNYPSLLENAIKDGLKTSQSDILVTLYFSAKNSNPEMFNLLVEHIKKFPHLVARFCHSPIMRKSFLTEEYIQALVKLQEENKDISEDLQIGYQINIDELRSLSTTLPQDSPFFSQHLILGVKDASEVSVDELLDDLCVKFPIDGVFMNNLTLDTEQREPYKVHEFVKCREIIEELLQGISIQDNREDCEKILFGQVVKRLAHHIKYDYSHVEESDRVKASIKEIKEKLKGELTDNEKGKLNLELHALEDKYREIDHTTPRNMVGGLINGICVCSGYAEIVRNVFACLGIETKYISGYPKEEGESGHAWNQIKLDGEWYNMDLTWDRDRLVNEEMPQYLLLGDMDFNKYGGHGIYSRGRTMDEELCTNTMAAITVQEFCNFRQRTKLKDKCKNWLANAYKEARISRVQAVGNAVIGAGNRARGQTYDKDERDR